MVSLKNRISILSVLKLVSVVLELRCCTVQVLFIDFVSHHKKIANAINLMLLPWSCIFCLLKTMTLL
jgi:hypothetical protein